MCGGASKKGGVISMGEKGSNHIMYLAGDAAIERERGKMAKGQRIKLDRPIEK